MAKYRKKPVVIEAVQWTGNNVEEIMEFMKTYIEDGRREAREAHPDADVLPVYKAVGHSPEGDEILIGTLEGIMTASRGDYIIRGVKGEYYPCKPDIFRQTHEEIDG